MTREEIVNSMSLQDAIQVFKDTNAYGTMDIAKSVILKALGEMPQWIPVSERLPEEDGQYLITVKYKPEADYEDIYAEHGEWTDGHWDMFCFGHCGEVEDIIAWMPLPEPMKVGEENC